MMLLIKTDTIRLITNPLLMSEMVALMSDCNMYIKLNCDFTLFHSNYSR